MNDKNKLYRCPVYLFCNYELLEKTMLQIAKECNVDAHTIGDWLRRMKKRHLNNRTIWLK